METPMVTTEKKKEIIVEEIIVSGYVKHSNGRKTKFAFDKKVFTAKEVDGILNGIGRIYQ